MGCINQQSSPTRFLTDKCLPVLFCTPAQTATLIREGRQLMLLVRHGMTDWNAQTKLQGRAEVPLNEKGRRQSYKCGLGIKNALGDKSAVKAVYTSPLSRAYDTAESITAELGMGKPEILEELIERDYGDVTGMTFDERRALYRSPGGYPDDIESTDEAAQRMKKTIKKITEVPGKGVSVIVTHGGILNSFFSYITRGRAGSGGNITANCTVEIVVAGKKDVIPIAFNLGCEELKAFLDEVNAKTDNFAN